MKRRYIVLILVISAIFAISRPRASRTARKKLPSRSAAVARILRIASSSTGGTLGGGGRVPIGGPATIGAGGGCGIDGSGDGCACATAAAGAEAAATGCAGVAPLGN